jgi:hypothetical protein
VLAKLSWPAPVIVAAPPAVGGDVLAVARVPASPRTISFAGRPWIVKDTGENFDGPGLNRFSDDLESVAVDGSGRLGLRVTQCRGSWRSAEVILDQPVAWGTYRFTIEGPIDALDPNLVGAGFLYESLAEEIDVELSRWGLAVGPNAQFVVQPWTTPGNRHPFDLALTGSKSTYTIEWTKDSVRFECRQGGIDEGGEVVESWTYAGPDVPHPDLERFRFNLWMFDADGDGLGDPPSDGKEAEMVVSAFEGPPLTSVDSATWGRVKERYLRRSPR